MSEGELVDLLQASIAQAKRKAHAARMLAHLAEQEKNTMPSFMVRVRKLSISPHVVVSVFYGVEGKRTNVGSLTFSAEEWPAAREVLIAKGVEVQS